MPGQLQHGRTTHVRCSIPVSSRFRRVRRSSLVLSWSRLGVISFRYRRVLVASHPYHFRRLRHRREGLADVAFRASFFRRPGGFLDTLAYSISVISCVASRPVLSARLGRAFSVLGSASADFRITQPSSASYTAVS